ncbi:MAG TPA: glycine cleavage system aminomethyltransferase GcvT [Spirochaetia bacterium]|nr:glycine cleavage system aminomethyltransferase GcvT [Spirochaetia bacterium]
MSEKLNKTILHPWHTAHGARFTEFAGWDMPIRYERGPVAEHRLVRSSCGLFDISHMGRFIVRGERSAAFLDRLLTAPIAKLISGQSSYALMCRDDGGVLDDVFVYRIPATQTFGDEGWLVVVNASNREKDLSWMSSHADAGITVEDVSLQIAMIAVQGPRAIELTDLLCDGQAGSVERFFSRESVLDGVAALMGRTGYTGEDGVELYVDAGKAAGVWEKILQTAEQAGIDAGPIGLAARDSLRFEPGFPLYGHELTETRTPLDAGLKWACDFSKPFSGSDAMLVRAQSHDAVRLVTLRMVEKAVPREGCPVFEAGDNNERAGIVVSGMYAPTADGYYANAYVPVHKAARDTPYSVEVHGRLKSAIVVKRPIYRPSYRSA